MPEWIEKTPWPAQGVETGTSPEEYRWGYLYLYLYLCLYRDSRAEFLEDERPTLREIETRWGHYLR